MCAIVTGGGSCDSKRKNDGFCLWIKEHIIVPGQIITTSWAVPMA